MVKPWPSPSRSDPCCTPRRGRKPPRRLSGPAIPVALLLSVAVLLFAPPSPGFPVSAAMAAPPFPQEGGGTLSPLVLIALVDQVDTNLLLESPPPFLRQVANRGGIALLSVRTDGPPNPAAAHLTLGAGAPGRAGPLAGLALDPGESWSGLPAAAVYRERAYPSGGDPGEAEASRDARLAREERDPGGKVVHLGFWKQQALNRSRPYRAQPGRLGDRWAREGVRAAVLGNADVPGHKRRYGALLAMDGKGTIPRGRVGAETLTPDPTFPFGPRTDYDALLELAAGLAPESHILVLELGDLARLGEFHRALPESSYRLHHKATLARIDTFLAELIGTLQSREPRRPVELWFVSPSAAPGLRDAGVHLPVFAWAPFPPGRGTGDRPWHRGAGRGALLRSPSTRRPGLVAAGDFEAIMAAAVRGDGPYLTPVPPESLAAHLPPGLTPEGDAWQALAAFHRRAAIVHGQRPPVLRSYAFLVIGALSAWCLEMLIRRGIVSQSSGLAGERETPPWRLTVWHQLLLFLTAVPAGLLLSPLFLREGLAANLAVVLFLSAGLTALVQALPAPDGLAPFGRLGWLSAAFIGGDLLRGAPWMKNSFLGYDPILGARFYGIGNEYMGFFVASLLIASSETLDRLARGGAFPRPACRERKTARSGAPTGRWALPRAWIAAVGVLYGAAALLLLWPAAGANVGGGVTAAAAFGLTLARLGQGESPDNLRARRPLPGNLPSPGNFPAKQKVNSRAAALYGGAILTGLLLFAAAAAWDAGRGEEAAHLGRFLVRIKQEGWPAASETVLRKLQLNWRLFRATIWSRVLILSLAITGGLLWRTPPSLQPLLLRRPFFTVGLQGAVAASLVALFVNDSGVVAAATALIPTTTALLYLVSAERERAVPPS